MPALVLWVDSLTSVERAKDRLPVVLHALTGVRDRRWEAVSLSDLQSSVAASLTLASAERRAPHSHVGYSLSVFSVAPSCSAAEALASPLHGAGCVRTCQCELLFKRGACLLRLRAARLFGSSRTQKRRHVWLGAPALCRRSSPPLPPLSVALT